MLSGFYPEIVAEEVMASHGVLACEGSTFKSTFSDVLTALMAGPLGAAARAGQPAIAYGAEVGELTPGLADYVRENAAGSLILARNKPSADRAANLGLRAVCGADTAWTFTPSSRERARTLLTDAGWNGEDPIVVFCPMNPFWWPVRAEPATYAAMQRSGEGKARHYGAVFFHRDSAEIRARYVRFIQALASAFERIIAERGAFPVIVGMDQVDGAACDDLAAALPSGAAVFRSREFSVRDIVALLREAQLLVSARFHALVGAMPAAVPSIGLAFDDRIRNLLSHAPGERVLAANAPDLSERIVIAAKDLEQDRVRAEASAAVAAGLEGMARMADAFRCEISRLVPDLSLPDLPDGLVGRLPVAVEQLLA
jgi:polysaccharide pyruvyl transferase WcaK-like protein